jgi:hypothetical protein
MTEERLDRIDSRLDGLESTVVATIRALAAIAGVLITSAAAAGQTQSQAPPPMSAQMRVQTWGACRSFTPDFAIRGCTTTR